MLEERKIEEIKHSDKRRKIVRGYEYRTDLGSNDQVSAYIHDKEKYQEHFSNMKFYSITRRSFAYRNRILHSFIKGKTVLDYCCGNGEVAIEMARHGADTVFGIDISNTAMVNANKLANDFNLSGRCVFEIMDAEDTRFPEDTFDVIHEYGSLHHLELKLAFKELSRILKPGGKLVCTEALRHNPLIHYYRKKTPGLRTEWEVEHILGVPEIMSGQKYFEHISVKYFHLASLAAVPFRKTNFFSPILLILEGLDEVILRTPYLQRLAWIAVIVYSNPLPLP